jgi:hypothetical protein
MLRCHWTVGFLLASACTSMQRVEPKQFIPQHKPPQVSVWTAPDTVLVVENPVIAGDSLVGVVFGERWGIPLKNVVRMEATAPDTRRTLFLLAGVTASVVTVYVINGNGGKSSGMVPCPPDGCDNVNGPPP